VRLLPMGAVMPIAFDLPEVAALMSSLAVLGPSVSKSAASAMGKLVAALHPTNSPTESPGRAVVPAIDAQCSAEGS
jgi:hypothetical protein